MRNFFARLTRQTQMAGFLWHDLRRPHWVDAVFDWARLCAAYGCDKELKPGMQHGSPAPRVGLQAPPTQAPYARHILLCVGSYCDPRGEAQQLYRLLAQKLGDLGRYSNPLRVKRGITPCLGVCSGGPLLVVYPDGIWYHHVTEAVLDRIINEHLGQGRPVEEYIFHRLDENPALAACPSACASEAV